MPTPDRCRHGTGSEDLTATIDAMPTESFGTFLRMRRSHVTPEMAGLRAYGTPRRVAGLRREELAQLAGVSVGYYTRLEQDQAGAVSMQVIDALARVLDLGGPGTAHLHNLARRSATSRLANPAPEIPAPRVLALLDCLGESVPAIVLGRRGDILAWNRTGHALVAEHLDYEAPSDPDGRPSIPRMFFLDPVLRSQYRNWEELARVHVAYLRLTARRYPCDARLADLIGELTMRSREFTDMWAAGDVSDCTAGPMDMRHPYAGDLDVDYQVWLQPDSPDHRLEVYTPRDRESAERLSRIVADSPQARFDRTSAPGHKPGNGKRAAAARSRRRPD